MWALLADAPSWRRWAGFDEAEVEQGQGLDEVRRVRRGRWESRERVVAFEPPRRFEYELTGLPMRDYRAEVTLTRADGGTDIRWHSTFRPKYPGTGLLMRRQLRKFLATTSEGLAREAEREET